VKSIAKHLSSNSQSYIRSNRLVLNSSSSDHTTPHTIKMQFSIIIAALAATATAVGVPYNSTATYYPTGTVSLKPSGTGVPSKPTSAIPFTGAAAVPTHMAGSALGLVLAGGVAMVSLPVSFCRWERLLT
jgi:hypothetical protein